jgi:DNA modification methylase
MAITPDWQTTDGRVQLFNKDCAEVLASFGNEMFAATVTDPPYGIKADEAQNDAALQRIAAAGKSKAGRGWKFYGETSWDRERPKKELFDEILRVGEKAIIWGGNYFADILPPSMGWLAWDKGQRNFSLADFELAWTSEWRAARFVQYPRGKALLDGKFHPTQKPIEVMLFCLKWLRLKTDSMVCDPFLGSGTTGVACSRLGYRFVGVERDPKYFEIAVGRIEKELGRAPLFEKPAEVQATLNMEDAA